MNNKLTIKNNSKSRRSFLQDVTKWIGGTAILAATANLITPNKTKAAGDPNSIQSGGEEHLGSISMVGFGFAPRGYALCNGAILPINQWQALFSLMGTTFGGDGRTTFGLPDFQGRVPVGVGNGAGLPNVRWGEKGGSPTNTLTVQNMPSHNHTINANTTAMGRSSHATPAGNFPAQNADGSGNYAPTKDATMNGEVVNNTGNNQAVNNMQPFLGIYFVIALQGTFPSRS
jgi:microcystin-dependent protein